MGGEKIVLGDLPRPATRGPDMGEPSEADGRDTDGPKINGEPKPGNWVAESPKVIETPMRTTIDVRRSITWGVTAIGCVTLPALAFAGLIGWADMSLPNGDSQGATLAGIVTVVALVLGLYLLTRVIRGVRGVFRPDSRRRGP
jgi:hypothetical protein